MATRKQIKIDEGRVVAELRKNPSIDVASLARKCGLSQQKVRRIIHRLEEDGTIIAQVTSFDSKKLGKRVYLLLFERSFKPVDEKLKRIMTDPFIFDELEKAGVKISLEDGYYITGKEDWALVMVADTEEDLLKFIRIWRNHYGEYYSRITQYEIAFVAARNGILSPRLKELAPLLR